MKYVERGHVEISKKSAFCKSFKFLKLPLRWWIISVIAAITSGLDWIKNFN